MDMVLVAEATGRFVNVLAIETAGTLLTRALLGMKERKPVAMAILADDGRPG